MSMNKRTTLKSSPKASTKASTMYIYKGIEDVPRDVTHVSIHPSVIEIERYAFKGCSELQSVKMIMDMTETMEVVDESNSTTPNKTTNYYTHNPLAVIGRSAFGHCSSLTTIDIPHGVTKIDENAFRDCTSLSFVNMPNSVTIIGIAAFRCCKNLRVVHLPSSLGKIGIAAFYHCESLVSVTISTGTTTTNNNNNMHMAVPAIARSSSTLSSSSATTIPSATPDLRIYPAAFRGCKNLINISLPKQNIKFIERSGGYDNKRYAYFSQCDTLLKAIQSRVQVQVLKQSTRTNTTRAQNTTNINDPNSQSQDDTQIHTFLQNRFNNLPLHQECYKQNISMKNIQHIIKTNMMKNTLHATDVFGMNVLHVLACNTVIHSHVLSTCIMRYVLNLYPTLSSMETLLLALNNNGSGGSASASTSTTASSVNNTKANIGNCIGLTPIQLFYRCNNININNNPSFNNHNHNHQSGEKKKIQRLCLMDALKRGLHWNVIDHMLILDPATLLELNIEEDVDLDDGKDHRCGKGSESTNSMSTKNTSTRNNTAGFVPFMKAAILPQCDLNIVYNLTRHSVEIMLSLALK